MWDYIKRYLLPFCVALFCLTTEAVCDLLQPTIMSHIVDDGVAAGDFSALARFGAVMLSVVVLGATGAVMRNIIAGRISQRIGRDMRSDIYSKIMSFSFENIDRLEPGSLVTRLTNDVTQVQNFINGCMRILVKAPITCIGAIVLIIVKTPSILPVLLVILPAAGVLITLNMRMGYPRFAKMQKMLDSLNTISREYLSSLRVVKIFGREDYERSRFESSAEKLSEASTEAAQLTATFTPAISLTINLGIVAMLWLGGYKGGKIPVGELMAAVNYMTQILFSVGMISNILNMLVRATASAERIEEVLSERPALKEPLGALPDEELDLKEGIEFRSVSFSYAPSRGRPAIENISFKAHLGETIGIIGSTGSGKSALVNLIPRFYDPDRGSIYIGGRDIKTINTRVLRKNIAIVPQKSLLFSGTIVDNLRFGKRDASEGEIIEAARIACADEFIEKFPEGYKTVLGQGGVNLSGGQKQRLALARALVKKPKILILDDCTSALDATTEKAVYEGIKSMAGDMLCFLITQRISSAMRADRIIVMENGSIVGMDTHENLMKSCDVYRQIYYSQIGGENCGAE